MLRFYRHRLIGYRLGANGHCTAIRADTERGQLFKRSLDASLAGLGMMVSAPIWIAIMIAIQLDDRGPTFYSQERVGKGGRGLSLVDRFRGAAEGVAPDLAEVPPGLAQSGWGR